MRLGCRHGCEHNLAEWLDKQSMKHVRGAPFYPQTQGKIERWHQTMKNRVLLENYYRPGDLECQIGAFVDYYNNQPTPLATSKTSRIINHTNEPEPPMLKPL
ncbi:Integrase core domain protein [Roseovarius gaetbuli]|uniref:Integrase core domain protein n=1 Tax=Roseovarius gaetbuli TaxID=1356575 RepID=A0A1X7A1Z5_9RHOB|nr:Integrase core domain protein [Roseovarius gaetbuli]